MNSQQNDQLKALLRTKRVSLKQAEDKQSNVVEQDEPADEGALTKSETGPVVARKFFKAKRTVPQTEN